MKIAVDACVLYPTVLRELTLGLAEAGWFAPIWTERILEEWRRAAARTDPGGSAIAEGEIADLRRRFPSAVVAEGAEEGLSLPDPADVHVLAAALAAGADAILTLNTRDFPSRTLARHGLMLRHPDEFLLEALRGDGAMVRGVVDGVLARASRHGIDVTEPRKLLKRARLPRLGKALYA